MKKRLVYIFVILFIGLVVISSCDSVKANPVRAFGNSCSDSDYGFIYNDPGTVTLIGDRGERQNTDSCRDENTLVEYGCTERHGGFIAGSNLVDCADKFGEGSTCRDGACVGGRELVLWCGSVLDEDYENKKVVMERDIVCNPKRQHIPIRLSSALAIRTDDFVLDCNGHGITLLEYDHNDNNLAWVNVLKGISIRDARRGVVKNCLINNFYSDGIEMVNVRNFEVSDNVVSTRRTGLWLTGRLSSNNKIIRNQIMGGSGNGLVMDYGTSNVIMNNVINNMGWFGLSISRNADDNIIGENNVCFNAREDIFCGNGANGRNIYNINVCDNIENHCNQNIECTPC